MDLYVAQTSYRYVHRQKNVSTKKLSVVSRQSRVSVSRLCRARCSRSRTRAEVACCMYLILIVLHGTPYRSTFMYIHNS
jgi:hypothetical protein